MIQKFTFAQRPEGFDNHINNSIRGYNDLCSDIINYSQYFVENETNVYDIGCSTGKMLKAMIEQNKFAPKATYNGIEIEEDFYKAYEEDEKNYKNLKYFKGDVRSFQLQNASLVTSIFTLQFIPQHERQGIVEQIYDALNVGGAFIFAEKTRSYSSRIHEMRTFVYYDYKRQNFDYDDIMMKEKTLRNMMKPSTREELIELCENVAFQEIDTFWQNHAFTGFIAIK